MKFLAGWVWCFKSLGCLTKYADPRGELDRLPDMQDAELFDPVRASYRNRLAFNVESPDTIHSWAFSNLQVILGNETVHWRP